MEEYYDILIIGRKGWGKKTLLDKLVGTDDGTTSRIDWVKLTDYDDCNHYNFQMVSNNKSPPIRVTIVPGFADINTDSVNSVRDRNAKLIHILFVIQHKFEISFKVVVYFLPFRGPPERADGYFRDELKTLWNFYEERVFQSMVMIATNSPDEDYQEIGFSESFRKSSMEIVTLVLSEVTNVKSMKCPPIVYLPLKCTSNEALDIVKSCTTECKPLMLSEAKRCIKCASQSHNSDLKCHPEFSGEGKMVQFVYECVPEDWKWMVMKPLRCVLPSLSHYTCMHCGKETGTIGCLKVGSFFKCKDQPTEVTHKYQ